MAEEDACEENEVTWNCIKQELRGSSMEDRMICMINFIENKACVPNLYMVYSKSGQENTRNTVRQAKRISFERNLKKELAKLVRM